jgi:hypothetical protein
MFFRRVALSSESWDFVQKVLEFFAGRSTETQPSMITAKIPASTVPNRLPIRDRMEQAAGEAVDDRHELLDAELRASNNK